MLDAVTIENHHNKSKFDKSNEAGERRKSLGSSGRVVGENFIKKLLIRRSTRCTWSYVGHVYHNKPVHVMEILPLRCDHVSIETFISNIF